MVTKEKRGGNYFPVNLNFLRMGVPAEDKIRKSLPHRNPGGNRYAFLQDIKDNPGGIFLRCAFEGKGNGDQSDAQTEIDDGFINQFRQPLAFNLIQVPPFAKR